MVIQTAKITPRRIHVITSEKKEEITTGRIFKHKKTITKYQDKKSYCEIRIKMPNNPLNYLHCSDFGKPDLEYAVFQRNNLIKNDITEENVKIVKDEKYYRLHVELGFEGSKMTEPITFHSRKLNLVDAVMEYDIVCQ